jgi:hypothetical protein
MHRLANCATANGREVNQTAQEALMTVESSVRVMHRGAGVVPLQAWSEFYAKEDRYVSYRVPLFIVKYADHSWFAQFEALHSTSYS